MGSNRDTDQRRWRKSLTERRGAGGQTGVLRDALAAQRPPFRAAVLADASVTARYRSERHEFRSRVDALGQVVRLMAVTDSFFAQVCYRAKTTCRDRRIPVLPALLHRLAIVSGQISIGDHVVMRPGVYIPHGQVVIDGVTHVGRGVVLRPFVTLGLRDSNMFGPRIGPRTRVGTGAKVFGPIRVGANCQIGANAVVHRDVPAGSVAVGVPAQIRPGSSIGRRGPAGRS